MAVDTALRNAVGLSGHAFSGWAPNQLLSFMAGLRIGGLDYWPWNRGGLSAPEFVDLAASHGVRIVTVNVPSSNGRLLAAGEEGKSREALLAAIDEAELMGADFVQFYTGVPESGNPVLQLVQALQPLLEAATLAGVVLVLENNLDQRGEDPLGRNPSRTISAVRETIERAGSPTLRLCLDPCNFLTVQEEAFPLAYDLLEEFTCNLHLKDCVRFSMALHADAPSHDRLLVDGRGGAFLPVPVGQGAINWDGILRRVARDGQDWWLTIDPFCSSDHLTAWCRESLDYLRRYLDVEITALSG